MALAKVRPRPQSFERGFRVSVGAVRPDGETRWIHSRGTLIRDERGKPYRASRISEDVSSEKLAQEALAEAQTQLTHVSRLTTVGELTTSIVHEVSQPVAAMIANAGASARWLAAEPPEIAEARAALGNITADGKRARDVQASVSRFVVCHANCEGGESAE